MCQVKWGPSAALCSLLTAALSLQVFCQARCNERLQCMMCHHACCSWLALL